MSTNPAPPPPQHKKPTPTKAVAGPARLRSRHAFVILSFFVVVIGPLALAYGYLWTRAADQYASNVGFSVRHEEAASPFDLLAGGIPGVSGSSSSDTDILYKFIQSQKLVSDMDLELNLKALWSKPEDDPIFSFNPTGSIEDLLKYWERMVKIYYDRSAGLIEIRVLAFSPDDATRIAEALLEKSAGMINDINAAARTDAVEYSWIELTKAKDRLSLARQQVQEFRNLHQLVDPTIEVAAQSQLIGALQSQMAEAKIALEILRESAPINDPRVTRANRQIEVIGNQIKIERDKFGVGSTASDGGDFATIIGEYERLVVEREFAEKTYISALVSYDLSLAEIRRKSRYLATYSQPTRAETPRFPQRITILSLLGLFLFLGWAIVILVGYSLKDRR